MSGKIRRASHGGSWYTDNADRLNTQLKRWLDQASASQQPARAIIAPHAGYDYSGPTAAFAYKQIDPSNVRRIFILGPSHHFALGEYCALSPAEKFETPIGYLTVDQEVYKQLRSTNQFELLTPQQDEEEHSLEMHLPYIAKIMEGRTGSFTIVPIMVGSLSAEREAYYGQLLAPYMADSQNLFVISSDFCHWGKRFRYTHYDKNDGAIWQSIEALDKMVRVVHPFVLTIKDNTSYFLEGMAIIESINPPEFTNYLKKYHNTICGRHPIGVLLNIIEYLRHQPNAAQNFSLKFVRYAQSSQCQTTSDSSVSYASASLVISD